MIPGMMESAPVAIVRLPDTLVSSPGNSGRSREGIREWPGIAAASPEAADRFPGPNFTLLGGAVIPPHNPVTFPAPSDAPTVRSHEIPEGAPTLS